MSRQVWQITIGAAVLTGAFYFGSVAQRRHGDLPGAPATEALQHEDLVWHTPTVRHEIGFDNESQPPAAGGDLLAPASRSGEKQENREAEKDRTGTQPIVAPDFSRFGSGLVAMPGANSPQPPPMLPFEHVPDEPQPAGQPASVTVTAKKPLSEALLPPNSDRDGMRGEQVPPLLPRREEFPPLLPERRLPSPAGETSAGDAADSSVLEGQPTGVGPRLVPVADRSQDLDIPNDSFRIHVVRYGETLQSLARQYYGRPEYYLDIYLANQDLLSSPIHLPVGSALKIPERNAVGR